jgi:NAD(P)-dependent dehydrogenase (short-subunit alcohol dehydrogenase family)
MLTSERTARAGALTISPVTNRLARRVCLVTGSTGIAAASAMRFAAEGAQVFVASRTEDHCRDLVDRIAAAGGPAAYFAGDLAEEPAAREAVDACVAAFGRIDGLFAVAGGSGRRFGDGPIHEVTRDAWDATLALNVRSQALVCREVVTRMRAQEPNESGTRGSILLMGSVTVTDPVPELFGTHAYAAARAATAGLMTAMAATYLPDRIRVNAVAPSLTRTPMASRAAGDERILAFARRKQPLAGEMMDPDEIAHAAVYFLSDESRTVTGQLLKIDGGWSVASVSPEPAG